MNTEKPRQGKRLISSTQGLDYEFLDSGNRRKLERFGPIITNRPEILASWKPNMSKASWESAHWYFFEEKGKKGKWKALHPADEKWEINFEVGDKKIALKTELTAFKHLGIFPEQAANWNFIYHKIKQFQLEEVKVLNLFAYTGAASLVAEVAGAKTTHVDSIKQVVNWAKSNAELNQIDKIRWIVEDARKFVKKALRRGEKFHGIILDPPAYGMGAKKEVWKLESDLAGLLEDCMKLLDRKNHFFVLNTYSPKLSLPELKALLKTVPRFPQKYEAAALGLRSNSKQELILGELIRFSS